MDETTVESILEHYGVQIPENIGNGARMHKAGSFNDDYPKYVVTLSESDGFELSNEQIDIIVVDESGDGVLVRRGDAETVGNWDYWTIPEDVTVGAVARLTSETDYIVIEADDAYTPPTDEETDEVGDCDEGCACGIDDTAVEKDTSYGTVD